MVVEFIIQVLYFDVIFVLALSLKRPEPGAYTDSNHVLGFLCKNIPLVFYTCATNLAVYILSLQLLIIIFVFISALSL